MAISHALSIEEVYATFIKGQQVEKDLSQQAAYYAADQILRVALEKTNK